MKILLARLQTHKLAVEKGVAHARLPIDQFIKMKTRKVLTIDHVFSILAAVTSGKSWKDAFLDVLPDRKGVESKEAQDEDAEEAGENVAEAQEPLKLCEESKTIVCKLK